MANLPRNLFGERKFGKFIRNYTVAMDIKLIFANGKLSLAKIAQFAKFAKL